MAADDKIMEALARIEHKLDLLLQIDSIRNPSIKGRLGNILTSVGDPAHVCPLCTQTVEYQIDINNAVIYRKCACKTGKIPVDLKAFASQTQTKKKEENNGGDQEDGVNPTSGLRGPGGR